MINSGYKYVRLLIFCATLTISLAFFGTASAIDDGARAYWKGRDGTQVMSFQYLNLNLQGSDTNQFDPSHFIYPNADVQANVIIASWVRHMTLLSRPSSLGVNLIGGSVDADVQTSLLPPGYLPAGVASGTVLAQSASGFADPTVQFDINLFGTPPLKSTVDLLNYEPVWTIDTAVIVGIPIGEYDEDKMVNMGLNRWYGRLALPIKYHFGVFSPGYMNSFEIIPSVWFFDENDDYVGKSLENDPMWQIEAHLTHDFTQSFFGSIDMLYRAGFQSEIDGVEVGSELDIGDLGFTLNYQVSDNLGIRTSFSSNVFGDDDLDNSLIRIQFVYGWHQTTENAKKLESGH
jgi:hypothetical protein